MLPTVASKNANLISNHHSKSRVISAAIHRTPRRLLPLNVGKKLFTQRITQYTYIQNDTII